MVLRHLDAAALCVVSSLMVVLSPWILYRAYCSLDVARRSSPLTGKSPFAALRRALILFVLAVLVLFSGLMLFELGIQNKL